MASIGKTPPVRKVEVSVCELREHLATDASAAKCSKRPLRGFRRLLRFRRETTLPMELRPALMVVPVEWILLIQHTDQWLRREPPSRAGTESPGRYFLANSKGTILGVFWLLGRA